MKESNKRQRAPNFTSAESRYLCNLVEKYKNIIENKKTDGATVIKKQKAWKALTKEYNSRTNYVPRTTKNLINGYKNLKSKAKRLHSSEEMMISNVEVNKKTIKEAVATDLNLPPTQCQSTFDIVIKEEKKSEIEFVIGTGRGPPPPAPDDPLLEKVLIGPSTEGIYTIYDSDANFMKQQQDLLPTNKQIDPIDQWEEPLTGGRKNEPITPHIKLPKRLHSLEKQLDVTLEVNGSGKKKLNVSQSLQEPANDKEELVNAQKTLTDLQIEHETILIALANEKLCFEKRKNEMELQFLKEKYKLELELLKNKTT